MIYWRVLISLSIAALWGCTSPQNPPVAQIGPHQITTTALRTYVENLPKGLRPEESGDGARQHYVQALIDRHLLLLEAGSAGFDTLSLAAAVQEKLDQRARAVYHRLEIDAKAKVSEEDVRRYFADEGYDRQRLAHAILVKDRDALDAVLTDLDAGQTFAAVARTHSIDQRSAENGGELGFIGPDKAPYLHIPLDVFRDLRSGQVSDPLNAGKSWHVVQFTQERPTDYQQYRHLIEDRLVTQRSGRVFNEHIELLKDQYQPRLLEAGMNALLEAGRKRDTSSLVGNANPLYSLAQGALSLGHAYNALQRHNLVRALADSIQTIALLERYVLVPQLLSQAARQAGIYDTPDMDRLGRFTRQEWLLETLRKERIRGTLQPSEEAVRQYYDGHPNLFQQEESFWIEELLLADQEQAQQIKEQLVAGALFENLVSSSLRPKAADNQARFHFHPRQKARNPKLVAAVAAAPLKEIVGPVQVEDGYSVFRVLSREKKGMTPYETSRRRARALLMSELERESLAILLAQVQAQYADQTEIFQDALTQALPDSLLEH